MNSLNIHRVKGLSINEITPLRDCNVFSITLKIDYQNSMFSKEQESFEVVLFSESKETLVKIQNI